MNLRRHRFALPRFLVAAMLLALTSALAHRGARPVYAEALHPIQGANLFWVTTVEDQGEGSLRYAIEMANARPGTDLIRFDGRRGPFATPQTITLKGPLPTLADELTIAGDQPDRLWQATGVTLSGGNAQRMFHIAPGVRVTLSSLTVAQGRASCGGGVLNQGQLLVKGVTFLQNQAGESGGAICNQGGAVELINSTFFGNRAHQAGGALADLGGRTIVTNCTFSENASPRGGGIYSDGQLLLRNTIAANSVGGADCRAEGGFHPASSHNLIETSHGCGQPISSTNPRLGALGRYNGPTATLPLESGSPAINLGANAAAVDENGVTLRWDQRGNGDPRIVSGITDIGAFEHQGLPDWAVDTLEDSDLRGCTRAGRGDCSLRGAITLANALGKKQTITFDPIIFSAQGTLVLERPLPAITTDLNLKGLEARQVTIRGAAPIFRTQGAGALTLFGVSVEALR